VYLEPHRRRVRALDGGRVIADSEAVLLVHRAGHPPEYAFPSGDVRTKVLTPLSEAEGYVIIPWDSATDWYEEEERVFMHPRNPYHRVDCLRTTRKLRVEVDGTVIVDTSDTLALYETALEPLLYVSREHVLGEYLARNPATTTYCPYKGVASYWNAVVGPTVVENAAWSYEDPLPESEAIRGLLSFDDRRVNVLHDLPPPALLT
jgi:uncharacterized protein (DUF427 family)